MLTDKLKLGADVAFVPYTKFTGQDFHPLRPFVADETGKDARTVTVSLYHDEQHPSTLFVPIAAAVPESKH